MNLKHMLPFLDDEELSDLAKKIAESADGVYQQGVTLKHLRPFVDDEDVDQMMVEGFKGISVSLCASFCE